MLDAIFDTSMNASSQDASTSKDGPAVDIPVA